MNWGLAWSGTENFGSKETYWENLTQSVIWSIGVDFCHCSVHWIYVITSNLQRAPGQVAQSSGPVQAPSKCLGANWSLAKRSLVGFLRISWSSCAMRLCEVLQWSSNAWAFEKPVRQTFVKVQLLTPKSEGPNNFSWLTEVQSKCQPDTFAKKQWQDSSREPLMSWWSTCVQKRLVKPRSQGSMDRKKKGKNLRKQGGMSQGKADDFSWFAEKRLWSCSDEATVCGIRWCHRFLLPMFVFWCFLQARPIPRRITPRTSCRRTNPRKSAKMSPWIRDVSVNPCPGEESYTAFDDGYHNMTSQESRSQTQNTQEMGVKWCEYGLFLFETVFGLPEWDDSYQTGISPLSW